MNRLVLLAFTGAAAVAAAGCEVLKSSTPTSPSVAGPIAGVSITAPKLVEPSSGALIDKSKQPLTLLVENATTTGERPLTYLFEVATDAGFTSKVFSRDGLTPGGNGRTSVQLADQLPADQTYYWRARAQDGANVGPFAGPVSFRIATPASLGAPTPVSPVNGAKLSSLPPVFVFAPAAITGTVGALRYQVEVASNGSFSPALALITINAGTGQMSVSLANPVTSGATYYWRVRATTDSLTGPWSAVHAFVIPTIAPSPSPSPSPGPAPTGSCASSNIDLILSCVSAKYPEKRAPVSSLDIRLGNMRFLRDRIIEAGICGGLDLAWNLKRGGPELSDDFIVHRKADGDHGYDFAGGAKLIDQWVQLQWYEGILPYYKYYTPRPTCK